MTAKEAFQIWWAAYPKKVGKRIAESKFLKYYPTMPPLQQMLITLEAQKRLPQWLKEDGEYIPHPSTYLHQGRYEDELKVEMPKEMVNGKAWHETWDGIVAKGKEHGLEESQFDHPQKFKAAVIEAAKRPNNVVQLRSA